MQEIADWLEKLGISEYAQRFIENHIDTSVLGYLTDQDLSDLGISSLGHRRKILRAIAELAETAPAKSKPSLITQEKPQDEAQRRQLTVMFCDLVGSTMLSAQLDPEDLREVIAAYHRCCCELVERNAGFVAKYMGDAVLAYFGYPRADEHDAERSVRAGLALVEAVPKLVTATGSPLQVRVGISTGVVVVGDLVGSGEAQERAVVGETPNLAARLQAAAAPNTVLISAPTRRLLSGLFEYEDLGALEVKGFAAPVQAYQVVRPSAVESRFEAMHTPSTPLVGRSEEIDLLMRRWEQAKRSEGCVVLLSGDAGIGKSRIAETIVERLSSEPHTLLRYFCSPHHRDSALYPIIAHLERAAGLRREDTNEQRLDKLEAVLAQGINDLSDVVPLLADLLSIPLSDRYPALGLSPQKRREKTLHAQLAQIEGLSVRQPLLMIFEDVHWSDPSTQEALDLIVDRIASLRVLLIITFRPEFSPAWMGRPHVTLLRLSRLSPSQGAEVIARVTGGKALPKEIADQIVDRTDGVPLFIEELTKSVLESGLLQEAGDRYALSGPPAVSTALEVPTTLHASLLARLDRLVSGREVAQIGAAIGRQFSHELISAVAQMPQRQVDDALAQLVSAELIFRRGTPPNTEYTFKHALVQDAAYQTVLRSKRPQYHLQIAHALEEKFPEIAEAQPHTLAHHYTEANIGKKAIPYLRKAGEKAAQRSANVEAVNHFTRALELLKATPESPERFQQELELQLTLGTPLIATKGFASPEVGRVYARARELCQQAGEAPQLFPVLYGLWVFYTARAEHQVARELGEQCMRLAEEARDPALLMEAHHALGVTLLALGQFSSALEHLKQAITIYDQNDYSSLAHVYGQDSGVVCRSHAAWALWFLGHPDQARTLNEQAVTLARGLSHPHPYSLAVALDFAAWLHQLFRDRQKTQELAQEAMALSTENEFVFWILMGMILQGWALTEGDTIADGIAQVRHGLATYRATGAEIMRPYYLGLLAEVAGKVGRAEEGLSLLTEALDAIEDSRECWWEAELHRLRGELTLARSQPQNPEFEDQKTAEKCFRQALNIASRQGAKSLELRATLSLSRLWQIHGKRAEARRKLAEAYDWFTEGLDTADLRDAKALLAELS
jgi:predicted ATPase/class 3 adenylate cyclase